MTYVTCRLTAKNRDQLRNLTLSNRVWATCFSLCGHVARLDDVTPAKWLFSSTSTYHSTDLLTARGVAHLVVHGTTGSTSYEIRFHPSSDWRALEACCRPWTWWCNDATALAGYATMTMMMMMSSCISIGEYLRLPDHPHNLHTFGFHQYGLLKRTRSNDHTTRYNTIRYEMLF